MTPAELRAMIEDLAGLPYGDEPVDQRAHALQTAALALAEGADDDLVLAALLHDIGKAKPVRQRYPGLGHDLAGERFCSDVLGERIAWLVGSHAEAKRYLVTTDAGYASLLTPASVRSLAAQGGPMSDEEVSRFVSHPWAADSVRLRRWDDGAKDPTAPGAELGTLIDIFERRMESDVVRVINKLFESVEFRDGTLFEEVVDRNLELHWPPGLPYSGVFRGPRPDRPGWGSTWNPLQPTDVERRLDPRIIATSSEEAVVLWHQRGLAPSGDRIDTPVLGLYRVVGGRLVRGQMFYFDPQAAARFVAGSRPVVK